MTAALTLLLLHARLASKQLTSPDRSASNALACAGIMIQPRLGDFLTARQAIAPFAFVQSRKGSSDSSRFRLTAALRSLRHRLLLQSVNARESANAILLQRYRFARFRADAFLLGQLSLAGKQSFAGLVFSHEARLRPHQGKEKSAIDTGQ